MQKECFMKVRIQILPALFTFVIMFSLAAWSQQPSGSSSSQTQSSGTMADHNKMMQSCHEKMQSMMKSNEKVKATIEDAKKSNDPAKMRSALDDAQKAIDDMDNHMNNCMAMMQKMHGPGMHHPDHMQHMKGTSDQQKSKDSTTPPK
jgi:uncharacterized protein YlxW (UPF0749 family)